eukprot:TRINITY_DN13096_c0_g1_i1.p2 TRINITY_DN13096_c0_g1~~TRINITY_DN13096_c0_g1_i1.p2  ORF type:complete len:325 (-),score=97.59 TRINITY_DN13096_c0_g1_i1:109-1083(-)
MASSSPHLTPTSSLQITLSQDLPTKDVETSPGVLENALVVIKNNFVRFKLTIIDANFTFKDCMVHTSVVFANGEAIDRPSSDIFEARITPADDSKSAEAQVRLKLLTSQNQHRMFRITFELMTKPTSLSHIPVALLSNFTDPIRTNSKKSVRKPSPSQRKKAIASGRTLTTTAPPNGTEITHLVESVNTVMVEMREVKTHYHHFMRKLAQEQLKVSCEPATKRRRVDREGVKPKPKPTEALLRALVGLGETEDKQDSFIVHLLRKDATLLNRMTSIVKRATPENRCIECNLSLSSSFSSYNLFGRCECTTDSTDFSTDFSTEFC